MHAHTLGAQRVTKRQRYFRFAHNEFLIVTTIWGNFGDACFGVDVVNPYSAVSQHSTRGSSGCNPFHLLMRTKHLFVFYVFI